MPNLREYQDLAFAGAAIESAGFNIIATHSEGTEVNTCPYVCGVDAEDFEEYTPVALGLRKDSGETVHTEISDVAISAIITNVDSVDSFANFDYMLIDSEVIKITDSSTGVPELQLTIERGQFGTTAAVHTVGTTVYMFAKGDKKLDFWGDLKSLGDSTATNFVELHNLSIDGTAISIPSGGLEVAVGEKLSGRFTKVQMNNSSTGTGLLQRR